MRRAPAAGALSDYLLIPREGDRRRPRPLVRPAPLRPRYRSFGSGGGEGEAAQARRCGRRKRGRALRQAYPRIFRSASRGHEAPRRNDVRGGQGHGPRPPDRRGDRRARARPAARPGDRDRRRGVHGRCWLRCVDVPSTHAVRSSADHADGVRRRLRRRQVGRQFLREEEQARLVLAARALDT